MGKQKTPNVIEFEFELAGQSGARYYLMPTVDQNKKPEIKEAKNYLRVNFDVASIAVEPIVHNNKKAKVS
jgi:hypothetical protein